MSPSMLEDLVAWIDERFGRRAAWITAVLSVLLTLAGIALIFVLLAR